MTDFPNSTAFAADLREILREGAEEVMGLDAAHALFERALSFSACEDFKICREVSQIKDILEEEYGRPAARGLALRIGRVGFRRGLKRWGTQAGLMDPSFRLLPSGKRIYSGLLTMAAALGKMFGMEIAVGQTEAQWTWQIAHGDRQTNPPVCNLVVGTLQEFLSWAGSGRIYRVRELECAGNGAPACLFAIDKKPLD